MTVARISIMRTSSDLTRTSANKKAEVERVLDELEEHLSGLPGYVMGFRFSGHEDEDEVGRVALWRTHQDADHAATLDHTVALRSQIHRLIDPGHMETLVEVGGTPKNIPAPPRLIESTLSCATQRTERHNPSFRSFCRGDS